jgi:pimeloyl-ACP methyl ester carboxylesterase
MVDAADTAFVLIHGGHQGSWFWERVVPLLERPALAVDLPGRGRHPADLADVGIEASVASVVADIEDAGFDRVILAGNSIASATIPGVAAELHGRVAHLVFLGTPIAVEGQTLMESFPDAVQTVAAQRIRTDGGATNTSDDDRRFMSCNDMDDEQADFVLTRAVPDSLRFFHEPLSWAGVGDVPRTYVRLLKDQALVVSTQDHMIENLRRTGGPVSVVDLDAGHCPMISDPAGTAAVLNRVATQGAPC